MRGPRGKEGPENGLPDTNGISLGFRLRPGMFIPFEVSDGEGRVDTVRPDPGLLRGQGRQSTDIAGMCERRPDVCDTGRSALHTIGLKARETARMAYAWIEDDSLDTAPAQHEIADREIMTGSIEAPTERAEALELADSGS